MHRKAVLQNVMIGFNPRPCILWLYLSVFPSSKYPPQKEEKKSPQRDKGSDVVIFTTLSDFV